MFGKVWWSSVPSRLSAFVVVLSVASYAMAKNSEITERVNQIVNWGEKVSTRGAKIEWKLAKTGEKNGHNESFYDTVITGLPRDQSYALFQLSIDKANPSLTAPELYISDDGTLCQLKDKCYDGTGPTVLLGFLSAKGEPHRILLVSRDAKYKIAGMVIPSPILSDDQGCHVEVIRGTARFELAIIRGKGFKPNEKFNYTSNSEGEILQKPIKADGKGELFLALGPFVQGKDQGTDEVTFGASGCAPKVKYAWGTMD
jgi:hypothetical protein